MRRRTLAKSSATENSLRARRQCRELLSISNGRAVRSRLPTREDLCGAGLTLGCPLQRARRLAHWPVWARERNAGQTGWSSTRPDPVGAFASHDCNTSRWFALRAKMPLCGENSAILSRFATYESPFAALPQGNHGPISPFSSWLVFTRR